MPAIRGPRAAPATLPRMPARRAASVVLAALLALALPGVVAAHSELATSDPADGATLAAPPTGITGDFTEEVDPARSSMELRGPDGARIATGGVPADGPATRMTILDLPVLAAGTYEVRWTTVTPDDAGVERGTFAFTVAQAASSPTLPATAQATTPVESTAPASVVPGAPAAATPTPRPAPEPAPEPASGTADLLVPILVLAVVLVGGAALFLRRRR